MQLVGERLQHQDFDRAARPLTFLRRIQEALQESACLENGASRARSTLARVMCSNSRT